MTDTNDTAANPGNQAQQDDVQNNNSSAQNTQTTPIDNKTVKTDDASKADNKPQDDWRVKLAGGDEKELKRLSRFASEQDVYKAYRELENKFKSGQVKMSAPKDGTPEEIAAWRKDNGIPDSPEAYDLSFDNGLVVGEEDKPYINEFLKSMHGHNATPDQVKAAIKSYYDIQAVQAQKIAEADSEFKDASLDGLREEWQGDFKRNINAVNNVLQSMPAEAREFFEQARMPDGRLLGNDPNVIKWLAATAFELNPAAAIMPASVAAPGMAIEEEIAALEKKIGDRESDYWKGPLAEKNQTRYVQLLDAKQKIQAKG